MLFRSVPSHDTVPEYYDSALQNPSSFIRMWFERVRHRLGHSIKHAVFQEFGVHPELGNEPRLHFHGVLCDVPYAYNAIREAVKDLGFVWIASITDKRLRYVVKYVGKSVYMDESSAAFAKSLPITAGKLNKPHNPLITTPASYHVINV